MGENGKPLYNAKDVAINLEKVGSIVESLDKLETKLKKKLKLIHVYVVEVTSVYMNVKTIYYGMWM